LRSELELARVTALGEAKDLLAAKEMAEQARTALRSELDLARVTARGEVTDLLAAKEMAEQACASLRGELDLARSANLAFQMSRSWRVTAPLRRIHMFLRRQ
jgi:hypothetical protein